jgi:hypothetical protein
MSTAESSDLVLTIALNETNKVGYYRVQLTPGMEPSVVLWSAPA